MIKYFYTKYLNYKITPAQCKNILIRDITMVFFTQAFLKEKQLFRTKFLFYSILSFYF
jgi:hypothetical protein